MDPRYRTRPCSRCEAACMSGHTLLSLQVAQMAEISQMKLQFSADINLIASCASVGFDSMNARMVEMSDILQRVVTLLTMK